MAKPMTNTAFMDKLMRGALFNESHPSLIQAFVIDALSRHAKAVASAKPEKFDTPLMNGYAWVATAQAIDKAITENYG